MKRFLLLLSICFVLATTAFAETYPIKVKSVESADRMTIAFETDLDSQFEIQVAGIRVLPIESLEKEAKRITGSLYILIPLDFFLEICYIPLISIPTTLM